MHIWHTQRHTHTLGGAHKISGTWRQGRKGAASHTPSVHSWPLTTRQATAVGLYLAPLGERSTPDTSGHLRYTPNHKGQAQPHQGLTWTLRMNSDGHGHHHRCPQPTVIWAGKHVLGHPSGRPPLLHLHNCNVQEPAVIDDEFRVVSRIIMVSILHFKVHTTYCIRLLTSTGT